MLALTEGKRLLAMKADRYIQKFRITSRSQSSRLILQSVVNDDDIVACEDGCHDRCVMI